MPDFGPALLDPSHGFAAVGAVPWVVNYNVLLHTQDMQACRSIAKAVSTRGGGLPAVEAMGLQHVGGMSLLMLMPLDELASDRPLLAGA